MSTPTALIAEDEPLLAAHLQAELARLWPQLRVTACVADGDNAVAQALALKPDVVFLDIRMPGRSGLDAAQAIVEDWVEAADTPIPLIVFVTAYDQYALQAFERAAVDYLLKPVKADRLAQTCARLREALERRSQPASSQAGLDQLMQQLRGLLGQDPVSAAPRAAPHLRVIQAGAGNAVHLVPVDEVLYFEAADKYVRVVTAEREHLIRIALKDLQPQLDPQRFWQIHRGTIVRCDAIANALRDESGKLILILRNHPDRLQVSRLYAHLFKAM